MKRWHALALLWVLFAVWLFLGPFGSYDPIPGWLAVAAVALSLLLVILVLAVNRPAGDAGSWKKALPVAVGFALVGGSLGLAVAGFLAGFFGRGTDPPPDTITDPTARDQFPAVLAYARGLTYDTDSTRHGMDEQWLEVHDTVSADTVHVQDKPGSGKYTVQPIQPARIDTVLGPHGWIYPESGSYQNNLDDLVGAGNGKGRVVAKFRIGAFRNAGYPKLGLPVGESYLWVDSMVVMANGDSASARALIITPDSVINRGRTIRYHRYKESWSNHASARWAFDPRDICSCVSCDPHGWCRYGCS